jgi:hypothetical protein
VTYRKQVREGSSGYAGRLFRYDPELRRVWVGGQRLHHGLTGALLAGLGLVLMAHDWHDRSRWFERGTQIRQR